MPENAISSDWGAMPDRMAATFSRTRVLITGATGLVGVVLLEKLLRKCPDIDRIFLLVRPKKGKSSEERMEDIFSKPVFCKLRELDADLSSFKKKVSIVCGDISQPDLGLSAGDRRTIIEKVDIIVHSAAIVRFDINLKDTIKSNLTGTKLLLDLAKQCKNLKLFIHISSAYSQVREKIIEEKEYPPPADPYKIMEIVELLDEDQVDLITPKLLDGLPNCYVFSKALSETLVFEAMKEIPAMVLRPSVVLPIWKEPLPGWTNTTQGPAGLLIGAGKGVIRTMYCKARGLVDVIPVDVVANGIMIHTWNNLNNSGKFVKCANLASGGEVEFSWDFILNCGRDLVTKETPLTGAAWYPGGSVKYNRVHHKICMFLQHWVPAYLIDCILYCIGYRYLDQQDNFNPWALKSSWDLAQASMVRVQKRISNGLEAVEFFTDDWIFKNDISLKLREELNAKEKQEYKLDAEGLDIMDTFRDIVRCARYYILKETDDMLPAARRHMRVLYFVDKLFQVLFWGLIFYFASGWVVTLLRDDITEESSLVAEI